MTLYHRTLCWMSHTCTKLGQLVCLIYMQPHLELEQELLGSLIVDGVAVCPYSWKFVSLFILLACIKLCLMSLFIVTQRSSYAVSLKKARLCPC